MTNGTNVIISGSQSYAKRPNLSLKKYRKNSIAATNALIEFDKEEAAVKVHIEEYLKEFPACSVITGGMDGVEYVAEFYALENKIKSLKFKPLWKNISGALNKRAGYDSILSMVSKAESALLIVSEKADSRTRMIIREMKRLNKPVRVVTLQEQTDHSSLPWILEP